MAIVGKHVAIFSHKTEVGGGCYMATIATSIDELQLLLKNPGFVRIPVPLPQVASWFMIVTWLLHFLNKKTPSRQETAWRGVSKQPKACASWVRLPGFQFCRLSPVLQPHQVAEHPGELKLVAIVCFVLKWLTKIVRLTKIQECRMGMGSLNAVVLEVWFPDQQGQHHLRTSVVNPHLRIFPAPHWFSEIVEGTWEVGRGERERSMDARETHQLVDSSTWCDRGQI